MTLGIDVHDSPIMRPRFDTRVRLVNDASKKNHKKFKGLRRELDFLSPPQRRRRSSYLALQLIVDTVHYWYVWYVTAKHLRRT